MNAYYERTGNSKRISIAEEGPKEQTKEERSEEGITSVPLSITGNKQLLAPPPEGKPITETETASGLFRVVKDSMDPASEVQALVDIGFDVNAYTYTASPILPGTAQRFFTPLHYAARWGKDRAIEALRYWGANANAKLTMRFGKGVFENTALHLAAREGHVEAIKALCEPLINFLGQLTTNAKVNAKDYFLRYTPMHSAAVNGRVEAIEVLHSFGADVNAQDDRGFSPLLLAAERRYMDAVKVLLDLGADVNAKDTNGNTVLETIRSQRNKLQRTDIPPKSNVGVIMDQIKEMDKIIQTLEKAVKKSK